jgi:hypothetical protein
MGVLGITKGEANDDAPAPEPTQQEPAPEAPAAAPEKDKGEFVPYTAVEKQARQPGSRRSRAAAAEMEEFVSAKLKPLEENWKTERQRYEERLAAQAQEFARMQGQLEALQRMPAPAAPAAPAPELPDPDKLMQEAEAALDQRDIRTYHQKVAAANEARAMRLFEKQAAVMRKEIEAKIPPAIPPEVQVLMAKHPSVAMAGQMGIDAVMMKDRELQFYGARPGPQRLAKAFELADQLIALANGGVPASSQKNDDAAQALSAVPTRRPTGGGAPRADDGVHLTQLQLETAKAAGMSKEEYVRWMAPEKYRRR